MRDIKPTLYLMWGGALFVLLIGCVNVANLVLVRSRARLKELATRLALGAGRWRIGRQLVTESVLLTLVSAAIGLLVGYAALQLLGTLNIQELPRGEEIRLDGVVVAYTLGVAAADRLRPRADSGRERAAGEPHRRAARRRTRAAPPASARARCAARWSSRRSAFAFVLLVGAGLLFASFRQVLAVDPGFNADGVLTASITPAAGAVRRRRQAARLHRRGAAPAARAAGRRRGRRDRHDSVRRQQQRQRHPRRGLPDEAGRVGDLAESQSTCRRATSRRWASSWCAAASSTSATRRRRSRRSSSTRSSRSASGRIRIRSAAACTCRRTSTTCSRSPRRPSFSTVVGVIRDMKLHALTEDKQSGRRVLLPDGPERVDAA